MLRRTFGDTNLEVSAISLGCWIFGVDWWGHYTDERGVELCRYAYDRGVTFFDNGVDYIDLYMAHNIKLPQFRDDLFAELEKMKDQGKIKVWGVSLGPAIGWREEGIKAMMESGAKAVQTVYNLFEQAPGREFCEVARAYQAGVLARVHDNSGILKGKMKMDEVIGGNDHRKFRDNAWKVYGLK